MYLRRNSADVMQIEGRGVCVCVGGGGGGRGGREREFMEEGPDAKTSEIRQ